MDGNHYVTVGTRNLGVLVGNELEPNLFQLRQVRGAREEFSPREIDQVQRAAISLHRTRDAIDELVKEAVEVDLLTDEVADRQESCLRSRLAFRHAEEHRLHHSHPSTTRLFSRAGSEAVK
jgi:hypothetical protein